MKQIINKKLPLITSCRFFSSFFRFRNSSLGMTVSSAGRSSSTFKSSDSSALNCEPDGRPIIPGSGENLSANNDVYQLKYFWFYVEDMHTQAHLLLNSLEFFHLLYINFLTQVTYNWDSRSCCKLDPYTAIAILVSLAAQYQSDYGIRKEVSRPTSDLVDLRIYYESRKSWIDDITKYNQN